MVGRKTRVRDRTPRGGEPDERLGVRLFVHTRVRHRLGGYTETAPPAQLGPGVDVMWAYQASVASASPPHRVLPSNGVSLCLHRTHGDDGVDARLVVMGPVVTPRTFTPAPSDSMEAVRIPAEWARALLGPAAAELNDVVAPLSDVVGRDAYRLRDQLLTEGGPRPLLAWFEERWRRAHDPEASLVAAALLRATGRQGPGPAQPLHQVAEGLGVSPRHLRRVVRRVTGTSAKALQRVDRFNRLVEAADRVERPRWSSLAVAHGYYDQAHLIQECRALTGETPVEVHRHRRDEHVRFFQYADAPRL